MRFLHIDPRKKAAGEPAPFTLWQTELGEWAFEDHCHPNIDHTHRLFKEFDSTPTNLESAIHELKRIHGVLFVHEEPCDWSFSETAAAQLGTLSQCSNCCWPITQHTTTPTSAEDADEEMGE